MRLSSLVYSLTLSLLAYPLQCLAEAPPFENDELYDNGERGAYPIQNYKSSSVIAPRLNLLQSSPECNDDLYTFVSPRGYFDAARLPRAVILDSEGALVWSSGFENKQIYNFMSQIYKGNQYLTFWAGDDSVGGHGAGRYYMLDQNYVLKHEIVAANNLDADLHEFLITEQGTALITVYQIVHRDLSALGKKVGPIWECTVQEIDIETGDLVFEWNASDHLNITDTYRGIGDEGAGGTPFDWFHLNSITKDNDGNYLVSSRYLHSITKIDGETGEVIWIMGGKSNMFKDLSGGAATNFAFQHDARWANDYTEITLFDNTDDGGHMNEPHPRGLRLRVDQKAMTVKVLTEYNNPQNITANSQGSMQDLDNGNVVVGYGHTGAYTEFAHDGTVLCDVHFGPQSQFGRGGVQSYRVFKLPWTGMPLWSPDMVVDQDSAGIWRAYVSWNGATEVEEWVLQGSEDPVKFPWKTLATSCRTGFETSIPLTADHPRFLRFLALDSMANQLGSTLEVDAVNATVNYEMTIGGGETTAYVSESRFPVLICAIGLSGSVVFAIGFGRRAALRLWRSWRSQHESAGYEPLARSRPVLNFGAGTRAKPWLWG